MSIPARGHVVRWRWLFRTGAGFLLGWLVPLLVGEGVLVQRTISIEVGMQNSG